MRRSSHNRSRSVADPRRSGSLAAVGRLFGTDGVRGVAGTDLTRDLAFGLGRAAVVVLGRHGAGRPTFLVGRDTRRSGDLAGGGAGRRHPLGGRRRDPGRRRTDPGDRVPHDRAQGVVGRRDLRLAQPAGGQRHQVLLARRHEAVRRARGRDRGACSAEPSGPVARARSRDRRTASGASATWSTWSRRPTARSTGMSVVVDCANGAASGFAPQSPAAARRRRASDLRPARRRQHQRRVRRAASGVVAAEVVRRGRRRRGGARRRRRPRAVRRRARQRDRRRPGAGRVRDRDAGARGARRRHRRHHGDGEPRVPPRDARSGHRTWSPRRWATATCWRRCSAAAPCSAASSRGTSSSASRPRPATACSPPCGSSRWPRAGA